MNKNLRRRRVKYVVARLETQEISVEISDDDTACNADRHQPPGYESTTNCDGQTSGDRDHDA